MKEQDLITKWLNHDLSKDELEEFKKLDSYHSLTKLSEYAMHFKAPAYVQEESYTILQDKLKNNTQNKKSTTITWRAIAAIMVISLGLFFLFQPSEELTTAIANVAEQSSTELPDTSQIILNADSKVSYDTNNWDRNVILDGEAFFKVAKGSTFTVKTSQGNVEVVGTEFSIKERSGVFEVICYEGKVDVSWNNKKYRLTQGNGIAFRNKVKQDIFINDLKPSWVEGISVFKSTPYIEVIDELQRQYNVTIQLENVTTTSLFTGSFKHKNIVKALESITVPLTLDYKIIDSNTIRILK